MRGNVPRAPDSLRTPGEKLASGVGFVHPPGRVTTTHTGERCPDCEGRTYVLRGEGRHARAYPCRCSATCRVCEGMKRALPQAASGFDGSVAPRSHDAMTDCACTARDERLKLLSAARLPAALAHASLHNYRPRNDSQESALAHAQDFIRGFKLEEGTEGFLLSGRTQTGKSHLLVGTLVHLAMQRGVPVRYVDANLLFEAIRRGFTQGRSGGELVEPLAEADVLAIDQVGLGRSSPFEQDTLDELIRRRYNAGRSTLLATSLSLAAEEPTSRKKGTEGREQAPLLRHVVGESAYSRLSAMCRFVQLNNAPNRRQHRFLEHSREAHRYRGQKR